MTVRKNSVTMTESKKWSLRGKSTMAKHFSEQEQDFIRENLLKTGKKLFETDGIKKTSVDKIVESVGIAKGSFYNFYRSKESLLYDIVLGIEQNMHAEEMKNLNSFLKEQDFPSALYATVWKSLSYLKEEPLLIRINDPMLINAIHQKITAKEAEKGCEQNGVRVCNFIEVGKKCGYTLSLSQSAFGSILVGFFSMYINMDMLGEDNEEAIRAIIKATMKDIFVKGN